MACHRADWASCQERRAYQNRAGSLVLFADGSAAAESGILTAEVVGAHRATLSTLAGQDPDGQFPEA